MEFIRDNVNKGKILKHDDKIMLDRYLDDYFILFWLQRKMKDMCNYNDNEGWKRDV